MFILAPSLINHMDNWFKRNRIHLLITAFFLILCYLYLGPAFRGKTLGQNDVTRAQSTQTEITAYRDKGTTILWTNQIHGGMPAFQIWAPYPDNLTSGIVNTINTIFPSPAGTVFILLLGTYFLFCVLKVNPWLAAAGAIAFTFSCYNMILLTAGHANQAFAIAFFAPVLAGILLVLRGKHLAGATVLALFLAMEIRANHIQMTYYLLMIIMILVGIECYHAIKANTIKAFGKSFLYLTAATLLAVIVNASSLWSTYEYGKDTIRGNSNLTQEKKIASTGLARDYAYEWSQGVGECITFLIPNAYGGGSKGSVNKESNVIKTLTGIGADPSQAEYISQRGMPLYWGGKPFTEGSFYFGAIICFLFVLGLFIVKHRIKWWLLSAVLLTMLLSFGRNWPYLSDIFFDYLPLYNKFRAVESILAIAGLCFPILAVLAINEVIIGSDKTEILKKLKLSFYITGGLCLVVAIIPGLLLSFKSADHEAFAAQLAQMLKLDAVTVNSLTNALIEDRTELARADAFRSFIFIGLAFLLIWAFIKKKVNVLYLSLGFLALVLVDLWGVDKRYLNDGSFVAKQDVQQPALRDVDTFILKDKDPDYRVIDFTKSIKSDEVTPYFHKSIGGYSAARLKRFEELMDNQLTKSVNPEVLNMLNTKYIITGDSTGQGLTVRANPFACGHAWFVDSLKFAPDADQEMAMLTDLKPAKTAVADKRYEGLIDATKLGIADTAGTIKLMSYAPDHLVYHSSSAKANIAVFSEIYYDKGWIMKIDGIEKPYFRADYVLRAAQIPAGNHKITFDFHPASYYTGEKVSLAGSILLVLAICGTGYAELKKKKIHTK